MARIIFAPETRGLGSGLRWQTDRLSLVLIPSVEGETGLIGASDMAPDSWIYGGILRVKRIRRRLGGRGQ